MSHLLLRFKFTGAFIGGALSCYLGQQLKGPARSLEELKCSIEKITSRLRKGVKIKIFQYCKRKSKKVSSVSFFSILTWSLSEEKDPTQRKIEADKPGVSVLNLQGAIGCSEPLNIHSCREVIDEAFQADCSTLIGPAPSRLCSDWLRS